MGILSSCFRSLCVSLTDFPGLQTHWSKRTTCPLTFLTSGCTWPSCSALCWGTGASLWESSLGTEAAATQPVAQYPRQHYTKTWNQCVSSGEMAPVRPNVWYWLWSPPGEKAKSFLPLQYDIDICLDEWRYLAVVWVYSPLALISSLHIRLGDVYCENVLHY